MIKNFLIALVVLGAAFVATPPSTAMAQGDPACNATFITFPAWYNGLAAPGPDGGCDIVSPTAFEGGFRTFIWKIVLNVIEIMLHAVGYLAVSFIIYGGYKYIYSAGSPDGMVKARKTILNAVIGLILSIMSVAIVNTIAGSLK